MYHEMSLAASVGAENVASIQTTHKKLGSICIYLRVNIDVFGWLLKRKESHLEGNELSQCPLEVGALNPNF